MKNLHSECYWLAQMCQFCLLCKIPFKMLQVFKNLQLFMEDKEPEDDLFDRLNVSHRFHQSVIYCLEYKKTCLNSRHSAYVKWLLLQTSILNKHLQELMDGLTAKVFRTYNASITLQQQLNELTTCKYPFTVCKEDWVNRPGIDMYSIWH